MLGGSSVDLVCGAYLTEDAACRPAAMQPALLLGSCCTTECPVFPHVLMLSMTPSALLQVLQCQKANAGFGGSPRHDPHILYTLSAVQILALYNKTDLLDADAVAACELGVLQARATWPACQCCACAPIWMARWSSGA